MARDTTSEGEAPAKATGQATGAQVIDLAELLSRSIKAAGKPGPAKAKESEEKPEKAKGTAPKKKRAAS